MRVTDPIRGDGITGPGPLLFETQPALVCALVASLYLGNVILIVLNLPLVGIWVKLLQIPRPYLYAGILLFAAFGAYALNFSAVDILILVIVGVLGYFKRRYGYPVAPLVVGMILGPMGEEYLRKALQLSQGDLSTLVLQPFAGAAYGVLALLVLGGLWLRRRQARYEQQLTETITVPISADQEV